jgi:hypothetical protein
MPARRREDGGHGRETDDEDLRAEVADLRRQVGELQGILAIERLKARYAELVDRRFSKGRLVDAETLAEVTEEAAGLFTADGEWDGGPALGCVVGRRAIADRLRRPTVSFARHFFLNPRISIDGTTATGRWDVLSPCRTADGTSCWMTGYEDDEYALFDGTWLHRRMRLTTIFMAPVAEGWTSVFA